MAKGCIHKALLEWKILGNTPPPPLGWTPSAVAKFLGFSRDFSGNFRVFRGNFGLNHD